MTNLIYSILYYLLLICFIDTRVIQMVAGDEAVYTLSQRIDPRTETSTSLVQAWATDSGDLLWDFAHAEGEPSAAGGSHSAMLLDEKQNQLRILDNSQIDQSKFFVLDVNKGTLLVQLLSTELEAFLPSDHFSGEEDAQLIFLHLVQDVGSAHVLSGCVTAPADDSSSVPTTGCLSTFVLDIKLSGVKSRATPVPRLHMFPGFESVTDYSQIQTRISSTQSSFTAQDAILLTVATSSQVKVTAVMLASEGIVSASKSFTGLQSATPVLLLGESSHQFAVNMCSSSGCAADLLELDGNSIQFREVVSCEGSSSLMSLERVGSSSGVSSAVTCLAVSGGSTLDASTCPAGETQSMVLSAHCTTSDSSKSIKSTFPYSPTLAVTEPGCTMTQLRDAFVHRYKVAATGEERLKVMGLSSTGSLHMFQKREKETNTLQWTREEALARVVDSVIVDGISSDPVGHKRVESLGGRIPTLEARLQMQLTDLSDMMLGWIDLFKSLNLDMFKNGQSGAADRPTLEAFGFNKVAVMFTSICDIDTSTHSAIGDLASDMGKQHHCLNGLKVYGVDLISGDVLWNFEPVVSSFLSEVAVAPYKMFGRLLKVRPHVHGSRGPEIVLLLSVESVEGGATTLLTYSFNPHTGEVTGASNVCESSPINSPQRVPSSVHAGLGQVTSLQLYNGDARGQEEANTFLLVHKTAMSPGGAPHVSLFPDASVTNTKHREVYTQGCANEQEQCASLVSYRVDFENALSSPADSTSNAPALYPTKVVGSVVFSKKDKSTFQTIGESVVAMQYPTAGDPIHSRAKVLGDNSLLIKYLNPHLVVVVTEKLHRSHISPSRTDVTPADAEGDAHGGISLGGEDAVSDDVSSGVNTSDDHNEEEKVDELFVNVIDTVSAQIVYRYSILHASTRLSGPSSVQVSWIENNLLVSYWSTQAQRQELSSVSLFEGMIDKYGLGPFSSVKVDQERSSFNSPAPIALQKTYVLPRKITAMHHTVTSRGITNKNLLLGLGSGQLYTVDLRMLDPRRPVNKPTPEEMEEKLMQYMPFLALHPYQMLSTNSTLPPVRHILSAPSKLESTSIVVTLGLDVYHTRTVPSKGFDMLASDFNKPLLSLILLGMGSAVVWLRGAYKKQLLSSGWK